MTRKTRYLLDSRDFRADVRAGMTTRQLHDKWRGARMSVNAARNEVLKQKKVKESISLSANDTASGNIKKAHAHLQAGWSKMHDHEQETDAWTVPTAPQSPAPPASTPPQTFNIGHKWRTFIAGSDIHGDMQDESANDVFFDFVENIWKPEVRVCMGDVWDFRSMRTGASQEERQESMLSDYKAGMKWLERFFSVDGEKYLLRGNHDERLWEWSYTKRGVEQDFAVGKVQHIESEVERMSIKMLPYHKRDGVLRLGHMKLLHGFFAGAHAARQHASIYDSCLFGHTHTIDQHPVAGLERRVARGIGALCKLDMPYNARQANTLRHAHGFAYGVLNADNGNYAVWQAESIDGVWVLPSDLVQRS